MAPAKESVNIGCILGLNISDVRPQPLHPLLAHLPPDAVPHNAEQLCWSRAVERARVFVRMVDVLQPNMYEWRPPNGRYVLPSQLLYSEMQRSRCVPRIRRSAISCHIRVDEFRSDWRV